MHNFWVRLLLAEIASPLLVAGGAGHSNLGFIAVIVGACIVGFLVGI